MYSPKRVIFSCDICMCVKLINTDQYFINKKYSNSISAVHFINKTNVN